MGGGESKPNSDDKSMDSKNEAKKIEKSYTALLTYLRSKYNNESDIRNYLIDSDPFDVKRGIPFSCYKYEPNEPNNEKCYISYYDVMLENNGEKFYVFFDDKFMYLREIYRDMLNHYMELHSDVCNPFKKRYNQKAKELVYHGDGNLDVAADTFKRSNFVSKFSGEKRKEKIYRDVIQYRVRVRTS